MHEQDFSREIRRTNILFYSSLNDPQAVQLQSFTVKPIEILMWLTRNLYINCIWQQILSHIIVVMDVNTLLCICMSA